MYYKYIYNILEPQAVKLEALYVKSDVISDSNVNIIKLYLSSK